MNQTQNARITFTRLSTAGGYGYAVKMEIFNPYAVKWIVASFKRLIWDEPSNLWGSDVSISHETLTTLGNFIKSHNGNPFGKYTMYCQVSLPKWLNVQGLK